MGRVKLILCVCFQRWFSVYVACLQVVQVSEGAADGSLTASCACPLVRTGLPNRARFIARVSSSQDEEPRLRLGGQGCCTGMELIHLFVRQGRVIPRLQKDIDSEICTKAFRSLETLSVEHT